MIQNNPILQPFIFLRIAHSQQIAQSVNLELVEILVDCAVEQTFELDDSSRDFSGSGIF
jgi:uncharacterized Rmd1/YagE family protein